MERVLEIGTQRHTKVVCTTVEESGRSPDPGGACYSYVVLPAKPLELQADQPRMEYAYVSFQNGPVKEVGVNGCFHEDLLAIVIDRLEQYQAGEYNCPENEAALNDLRQAMANLRARTDSRQARGVEGTSEK